MQATAGPDAGSPPAPAAVRFGGDAGRAGAAPGAAAGVKAGAREGEWPAASGVAVGVSGDYLWAVRDGHESAWIIRGGYGGRAAVCRPVPGGGRAGARRTGVGGSRRHAAW